MRFLEAIKKWLVELTEVGLLLVVLGIVVEILFAGGPTAAKIPFFGAIVPNLTRLISGVGESGLAGLIALGIIVFLYRKRTTA